MCTVFDAARREKTRVSFTVNKTKLIDSGDFVNNWTIRLLEGRSSVLSSNVLGTALGVSVAYLNRRSSGGCIFQQLLAVVTTLTGNMSVPAGINFSRYRYDSEHQLTK